MADKGRVHAGQWTAPPHFPGEREEGDEVGEVPTQLEKTLGRMFRYLQIQNFGNFPLCLTGDESLACKGRRNDMSLCGRFVSDGVVFLVNEQKS